MQLMNVFGWKGIQYSVGDVSLTVVPDLGGRIISLSFKGQEIFFIQKEHQGEVFDFTDVQDLRAEKRRLGFRVWGGNKTWIAPEKDWWEKIPPLELDAGRYHAQVDPHQVRMVSSVCQETGLQIVRAVKIQMDGVIILDQEIINKGRETVCKGIWNVTQLIRPCDVYVPAKKEYIRSYHQEDATLPKHSIELTQIGPLTYIPCREHQLFKFGGMITQGHALSLFPMTDGQLALLKTFSIDANKEYLHRSMVEVFNAKDHDYVEVEIHAPAANLRPGESSSHSQQWRLKQYGQSVSPREIFNDIVGLK